MNPIVKLWIAIVFIQKSFFDIRIKDESAA